MENEILELIKSFPSTYSDKDIYYNLLSCGVVLDISKIKQVRAQ